MGAGRSYINLSELVKDQNIHMQISTYRCGRYEMASRAAEASVYFLLEIKSEIWWIQRQMIRLSGHLALCVK